MFIWLTRPSGTKMLVNTGHILEVSPTSSGAWIQYASGNGLTVSETVPEIEHLINMAKCEVSAETQYHLKNLADAGANAERRIAELLEENRMLKAQVFIERGLQALSPKNEQKPVEVGKDGGGVWSR